MVDLSILKECLKKTMPDLHEHFEDVGFEPSQLCLKWFLCIYTQSFKESMSLKILDLFLLDGCKSLYLLALAIFSENSNKLLLIKDNTTIMTFLTD